jgi:Fanconi anemia group M protein
VDPDCQHCTLVLLLLAQVMSNDLSRGLFPARDVKLLIVDEAHRAQGDYAYCLVARELARSATIVRIVALSGEAFFFAGKPFL